jgi:hypothetical protein
MMEKTDDRCNLSIVGVGGGIGRAVSLAMVGLSRRGHLFTFYSVKVVFFLVWLRPARYGQNRNITRTRIEPMTIQTFVPAALIADACRRSADAVAPPVVRISRMEAILADVFEKGLAAIAPLASAGQDFQQAA